MGGITCPHTSCSIALGVVGSLTDLNVGHAVVDCGSLAGREPVLHVRVSVAEPVAGQAWHGVVYMRDAVFVARLLRDVTREVLVADAWRSISEDVTGITVLSEPCTSHGGHGSTQAVARGDDAEVRVAFAGRFDKIRHGRVHVVE